MEKKPKTTLPSGELWALAFIVLEALLGTLIFYPLMGRH